MENFESPFVDGQKWQITQLFMEKVTNPLGHTGVDFACYYGTLLYAPCDGIIAKVGFEATGYGKYLIIKRPDGSGILMAHLSFIHWSSGYSVKAGELIAQSGNSGNSTGAHLHIEYRRVWNLCSYDSFLDPLAYCNFFETNICQTETDKQKETENSIQETDDCDALDHALVVCSIANLRDAENHERVVGTLNSGAVVKRMHETITKDDLVFEKCVLETPFYICRAADENFPILKFV